MLSPTSYASFVGVDVNVAGMDIVMDIVMEREREGGEEIVAMH